MGEETACDLRASPDFAAIRFRPHLALERLAERRQVRQRPSRYLAVGCGSPWIMVRWVSMRVSSTLQDACRKHDLVLQLAEGAMRRIESTPDSHATQLRGLADDAPSRDRGNRLSPL
jgi:hypothetical protein